MAKYFLIRAVFLLVACLPAAVSAQGLDDYYLTRLAPQPIGAHMLSGIAADQAVQAQRCQTGIRHAVRLDWEKLQTSTQKTLAKELSKPVLSGERTCTPVGGHFTIHYATSGSDAPDPKDVNANNVPDWVETVAGVFEYVYDVEVTRMGYRTPPGSSYHVYLRDLVPQRAYGFTNNDGAPAFPATSVASYIEIDRAFTSSIFTANGLYSPEQLLRITAAHEFHHAIQYGYNYYFDIWFAEMTSTWMEDEVYDSVNQLYSYLPNYLPRVGTLSLSAPIGGNSEYGRWIFNRYLTETQGSRTAIRSMWEELGTRAAPSDGSDIPMLPVIQEVLQDNLGNNFFGFAKQILLRDWSTHLVDITRIPELAPSATFSVNGAVAGPINVLPTPYTFAFYKYIPSTSDVQPLVINLPSLSSALAVSAFKLDSGSGWQEYRYDSGSITIPAFTSDAVVYLVMCNNEGGGMQDPVVVPFPDVDSTPGSDGSALDGNTLPIPAQDPLPAGTSSAAGGSSGGCFIATAAYGSYLHPKVALLRAFRDRQLMTNPPGRLFVALYYRVSPPFAELIARHEVLRGMARLALTPVLFAVEHLRVALLLLGATLLLVPITRRATRSARANHGVSL